MTKSRPARGLAAFLQGLIDEASRRAMVTDGDIEATLADEVSAMLQSPQVRLRIKNASPQERVAAAQVGAEFSKGLGPELAPDATLRAAAAEQPALASAEIDTRIQAATPSNVGSLLTGAAASLVYTADVALEASADNPPSQNDLAEWLRAGTMAPGALQEVEQRIAALHDDLDGADVQVTGWVFGGLVALVKGTEVTLAAHDLLTLQRERASKNPLAALCRAYDASRPLKVSPNLQRNRIFPSRVAQIDGESHPRKLAKWFAPAMHRRGQLVLPGFGPDAEKAGPALPLALYGLGDSNRHHGGGRGAPLALRLFVEAILAAPYSARFEGGVQVHITLRELLRRLYPGRRPKPNEYYPRLLRARDALHSIEATVPWEDPETGRGGLLSVVLMRNVPRPGHLDDEVILEVTLPPGAGPGPIVSPRLGLWGVRSAPAYNALLNLPLRWWYPGRYSHKVRRGRHWLQSYKPDDYPELSDTDVVDVTRPLSARSARRNLVVDGWATVRELAEAGEFGLEGRIPYPLPPKALPPGTEEGH